MQNTLGKALNDLQPVTHDGDGRDLSINCPKCRGRGVHAVAFEQTEVLNGVIRHTTTWVRCKACGGTLFSKARADDLRGKSPEQLERLVVWRVSLVSRATAVLALLLCLFPFVGLAIAVLAVLCNFRRRGWLRTISYLALAIGIATSLWLYLSLHSAKPGQH